MNKKDREENLGIKIGSEDEVFWTKTLKSAEAEVLQGEREKEINEQIVTHAKKRIAEEKEKFK